MQPNFTTVHNLSFEQKERLHESISSIIEKVTGRKDATNLRIEKNIARYVIKEWNKRADKAIAAGVAVAKKAPKNGTFTKARLNQAVNAAGKAFATIDSEVEKRVTKEYRLAYANTKKMFMSRFKVKEKKLYFTTVEHGQIVEKLVKSWSAKKIAKATISGVNFSIQDTETTKQLGRLVAGSIGDHYEKHKKQAIIDSITQSMEDGLTNEEAADQLQKELTRRLGGTEAALSAVPESVATLGQNSINAYFEGLVATNMNWAQNFSRVNAMREAEITRYRIAVVVDGVTSDICLEMAGREFELSRAIEYMDTITSAEDADEIKDYAEWRDDLSGLNVGDKGSASAEEVLAANGLSMPPYHNHCRTEVEPA